MWRDKLMEGILFVWKLVTQNGSPSFCRQQKLQTSGKLESLPTWGESLNIGAQTISGVEWCLAARARVCVPLTALRPPFARTVCVPIMTWKEITTQGHRLTHVLWHDCFKVFSGFNYLIYTRHDCKYGSVCDHSCFDAGFWETSCHLMSLMGGE